MLVVVPTGGAFAVVALTGGSEQPGGTAATRTAVAKLGLVVPLSGRQADVGTAVRNAVELAVDEANATRAVPGWQVELVVHDDLSRPDGGASAADELAADDAVVGVVGPLNSTVAMAAVPVLADAGIAVVSPSNSRPDLTGHDNPNKPDKPDKPDDPGGQKRKYRTYFRLSGTDDFEASAAARYAVETLGRSRVAVIDGGPDYGDSIARRFAGYVGHLGAQVTSVQRPDANLDDKEQAAATAKALLDEAPDLVYVAADPEFAVELRKRLASELPSIPVLGSDALLDARYVEEAGPAAEGDVVTDLGVPVAEMPASGAFVAAYAQRWFNPQSGGRGKAEASGGKATPPLGSAGSQPNTGSGTDVGAGPDSGAGSGTGSEAAAPSRAEPSASRSPATHAGPRAEERIPSVAAYAYDAARAVLRAFAVALPGRATIDDVTRGEVVSAVNGGRFSGVTGIVAFDRWGDTEAPAATVYTVLDGHFVPLRVIRG
jgi:ABC-type branched-subunit amino acid transport system substrate-binding protein